MYICMQGLEFIEGSQGLQVLGFRVQGLGLPVQICMHICTYVLCTYMYVIMYAEGLHGLCVSIERTENNVNNCNEKRDKSLSIYLQKQSKCMHLLYLISQFSQTENRRILQQNMHKLCAMDHQLDTIISFRQESKRRRRRRRRRKQRKEKHKKLVLFLLFQESLYCKPANVHGH